MLVVLVVWRHGYRRFPLRYDPLYCGEVFPLGMYAACTQQMIEALGFDFLRFLPRLFVHVALAAWVVVFLGLVRQLRPQARGSGRRRRRAAGRRRSDAAHDSPSVNSHVRDSHPGGPGAFRRSNVRIATRLNCRHFLHGADCQWSPGKCKPLYIQYYRHCAPFLACVADSPHRCYFLRDALHRNKARAQGSLVKANSRRIGRPSSASGSNVGSTHRPAATTCGAAERLVFARRPDAIARMSGIRIELDIRRD